MRRGPIASKNREFFGMKRVFGAKYVYVFQDRAVHEIAKLQGYPLVQRLRRSRFFTAITICPVLLLLTIAKEL